MKFASKVGAKISTFRKGSETEVLFWVNVDLGSEDSTLATRLTLQLLLL